MSSNDVSADEALVNWGRAYEERAERWAWRGCERLGGPWTQGKDVALGVLQSRQPTSVNVRVTYLIEKSEKK